MICSVFPCGIGGKFSLQLLSCLAVVPHVTGTASYAKSSPMDSATNSSTRSFSISYVTAPSEEVAEKIAKYIELT